MAEFPSEIYQVQAILDKYILIHDKIFKLSLRKVIPIPGIFKPINYGQQFKELDSLTLALEQIVISASDRAKNQVFQQYVTVLLATIQSLRDICRRLYYKSEGDLQSYTINQYKSDVATYEALVDKYSQIGLVINKYLNT